MGRRDLLQLFAAALVVGAGPSSYGLLLGSPTDQSFLPGAMLNHVMVRVPDMEQAKRLYAEKFGFREVFSFESAGRKPAFTYLQISRSTFLEIQPASDQHPPGIGHVGLQVGNLEDAVKQLGVRGLTTLDPGSGNPFPGWRTSPQTGARISFVQATPGVTFELLEFPPNSLFRKAVNS